VISFTQWTFICRPECWLYNCLRYTYIRYDDNKIM